MAVDVPSVREAISESASFSLCSWNNTSDNLWHVPLGSLLPVFPASSYIHISPIQVECICASWESSLTPFPSLLFPGLSLCFWNSCLNSCCLSDSSHSGIDSFSSSGHSNCGSSSRHICGSSGFAVTLAFC